MLGKIQPLGYVIFTGRVDDCINIKCNLFFVHKAVHALNVFIHANSVFHVLFIFLTLVFIK